MTRFILFMLGIWLLLIQLMPDKLADVRILPIMLGVLLATYGGMRLFNIGGKVVEAKPTKKKSRKKVVAEEIPADPDMRKVRAQKRATNPDLWMKPRPTTPVQLDLFGNAVPVQNGNLQYHAPRKASNVEPDWNLLPPPPGVSADEWGR